MLTSNKPILIFLTFVWTLTFVGAPFSHAASNVTTQLKPVDIKTDLSKKKHDEIVETLGLAEKPVRNFGFYIQYVNGEILDRGQTHSDFHYGFQVKVQSSDLRASYSPSNIGNISLSRRGNLLSEYAASESYEPYFRYGIGWYLKPEDGFTSFANTKRIHVFGGLGYGDLLRSNRRLFTEVGIGVGLTGASLQLLFGVTF